MMIELALPGSAYIYQGDELGLQEVGNLKRHELKDPIRFTPKEKGRDGCRVPLPWTSGRPSFGFGQDGSWLPQPEWFREYAVSRQAGRMESALTIYKHAIKLRKRLLQGEGFDWVRADNDVLHFRRPGGWHSITNFGQPEVALPEGQVL